MRKLLFAALLCAPSLSVAQSIDQQQLSGPGLFSQLGTWQAQSFTTSATTLLGGGFQLFASGQGLTEGAVELRLYDGLASAGGQMLALSSQSYAIQGGSRAWVDAFWSPVSVTSGGTYYLYLIGVGPAPVEPVYSTYALGAYAGGNAYASGTATITDPFTVDWSAYDISFRTWKPTPDVIDTPPITTVPEPSTYAMLATGLLAVGLAARRRRI